VALSDQFLRQLFRSRASGSHEEVIARKASLAVLLDSMKCPLDLGLVELDPKPIRSIDREAADAPALYIGCAPAWCASPIAG